MIIIDISPQLKEYEHDLFVTKIQLIPSCHFRLRLCGYTSKMKDNCFDLYSSMKYEHPCDASYYEVVLKAAIVDGHNFEKYISITRFDKVELLVDDDTLTKVALSYDEPTQTLYVMRCNL